MGLSMASSQLRLKSVLLRSALLLLALSSQVFAASNLRKVVSLDGTWEIAQGSISEVPKEFDHTAAVPGIVTMATPAFTDVGRVSEQREAFWYRRVFTLDSEVPQVATLKINKAKFGTVVYLNGEKIMSAPC